MKDIIDLIIVLLNFILVTGLAYVATRKFGMLSQKGKKEGKMKLVDTLPLGPTQTIHMIEIGNQYYLIGKTKERIEYFGQIEREQTNGTSI